MLHAHAREFATPRSQMLPGRLTPAEYLRLRMKAAGVTARSLADRLAIGGYPRDRAHEVIELLSQRGAVARDLRILAAIERVMPIDAAVYQQLATEPADRHPDVCRGCGHSRWDRADEDGVRSHRRMLSPHICSHCVGQDA